MIYSPRATPSVNKSHIPSLPQNNPYIYLLLANIYNCSFAEANYTMKIEKIFLEVKEELTELKEEIRQMKGNPTGRHCIKGLLQTCASLFSSLGLNIVEV